MSWILIQSQTLGTATASVTFSSIPQTYKALWMVASVRSSRAGNWDDLKITFNGATTGYSDKEIYGTGSAASSPSNGLTGAAGWLGSLDAGNQTANTFGSVELHIPNYTSATAKAYSVNAVGENNATEAIQFSSAGLQTATSAITSISMTFNVGPTIAAGSSFHLYGLS